MYKEGDVAEAERSLPIINGIVSRVTELLIEWPEHPILNQVCEHSIILIHLLLKG